MSEAGGPPTEPAPSGEPHAGLRPGERFAGLVVEEEAGRGGMGVIYRARDPELDRPRALKVLAAERSGDAEFRERFRRESRQAAAIDHPNVIPVYRAGEEAGRLFIVMRFVDGPSLADVLAERGRLTLEEVVALVRQVAAGLDEAHAQGLVHRDVKPGNVLLEGEGPGRRAFLGDFGISKLASAGTALTSTGRFVGTVDYVAPEQLEGEGADARSDVYSLACVAFHALTGAPPFRRETQLATMFAHANAPRPDPGPALPSKVREVLARGMAVRPDDRPASAGAFAAELERAAGAAHSAPTESLAAPGRARRLAPLAGLALLLVAAALAAWALLGGDEGGGRDEAGAVETRAFEVPKRPLRVAVGPGRAWAVSPASAQATSLALDEPVPQAHPAGAAPAAVAIGHDSVWIVDRELDALLRLDPASGAVRERIAVGTDPADVAVGHGDVWVANAGGGVTRVGAESGEVEDTIPVGERPSAIAASATGVWVVNRDGGDVSFIDPAKSHVTGTPIPAGQRPNDVAVGAGHVWVTDNFNGTLIRIDERTREPAGEPVPVGALPRAVAVGLGYVWVASGEEGVVRRLDPATAEPVGDPIAVGAQPASLAVGPESVWTADFGDSTVTELRPDG